MVAVHVEFVTSVEQHADVETAASYLGKSLLVDTMYLAFESCHCSRWIFAARTIKIIVVCVCVVVAAFLTIPLALLPSHSSIQFQPYVDLIDLIDPGLYA